MIMMRLLLKITLMIFLTVSLIVSTGCLTGKATVIPDDRELVACPLSDGRVSINTTYLSDIYSKLKDCGFDLQKLPKIPDETGSRVSVSKGHLREIKQGLDNCN